MRINYLLRQQSQYVVTKQPKTKRVRAREEDWGGEKKAGVTDTSIAYKEASLQVLGLHATMMSSPMRKCLWCDVSVSLLCLPCLALPRRIVLLHLVEPPLSPFSPITQDTHRSLQAYDIKHPDITHLD